MYNNFKENKIDSVVSDLTISLLFIFIIALVAHVLTFNSTKKIEEPLKVKVNNYLKVKSQLIRTISEELKLYGVNHMSDTSNGVIRFKSDAINFKSGSYHINDNQISSIKALQKVLEKELVCFTNNSQVKPSYCKYGQKGQLKRIIIEGHTDNIPIKNKQFKDNIELSILRAKNFYDYLISDKLKNYINQEKESLFVIAGFGENKPLKHHKKLRSDVNNRRIDIKFDIYFESWSY